MAKDAKEPEGYWLFTAIKDGKLIETIIFDNEIHADMYMHSFVCKNADPNHRDAHELAKAMNDDDYNNTVRLFEENNLIKIDIEYYDVVSHVPDAPDVG